MSDLRYKRRATLVLTKRGLTPGNNPSAAAPYPGLDLSDMHFSFRTAQQDVESPNNCSVRVYNLSADTVRAITKFQYDQMVLQAGYDSAFGVIFQGNVKQYRVGRESATTTYLDILAADGDLGYNFSYVRKTIAAGETSAANQAAIAIESMRPYGLEPGRVFFGATGGTNPNPRGKTMFAKARMVLRTVARSQGATWNIANGVVNVTPLDGYLPGEAVVLTSQTGLVGIPEQTEDGIKARCLLDPRITLGNVVQIDNASINRLIAQNPDAIPLPYNKRVGPPIALATVANDGFYRVFVAEYEGDTRGQAWYVDLTCLRIDQSSKKVLVP